MRDSHHAPANHRSKSTPDLNKKLQKSAKKNLKHEFTAVSEDEVMKDAKQFTGIISPISEVSVENQSSECAENFISPVNPLAMTPSETVYRPDLSPSPLSSITCCNASANKSENSEGYSFKKIDSVEAEIVIRHLRNARIEVLNSKDLDHSKKLLDSLLNIVIDEFNSLVYKEENWLNEILTSKANLVFLSFLMGIFASLLFLFIALGAEGHITGPPPT